MKYLDSNKTPHFCNQTANIDLKLTLTSVILKDQHVREIREKSHPGNCSSQIWERHRTLYGSDHTDVGKEEAWVDPLSVVVAGNCCICRVAQRESERRQPEVGGGTGGGYAEEVSRPVECTAGGGRPGPGCGGHHHCQLTTTPQLRHRPNPGPSERASCISFLQNDIVGSE